MKNPVATGLGAIVAVLAVLYGIEKAKLAGCRSDAVEAQAAFQSRLSDYQAASAARLQAASEALQREKAERDAIDRQNQELIRTVQQRDEAVQSERRQARSRITNLEAENEVLRNWNHTDIPDDMVDWMLEPLDASVSGP